MTSVAWASLSGAFDALNDFAAQGGNVDVTITPDSTPSLQTEPPMLPSTSPYSQQSLSNNKIPSWTPLHAACAAGNRHAVLHLVRLGADVRKHVMNVDDLGNTYSTHQEPLHLAARFGHASIITLLLSNGAQVNCLDSIGATPLHYAAAFGHCDAVRALLERGAAPEVEDNQGWTPNDYATTADFQDVLSVLASPTTSRPSSRLRAWLEELHMLSYYDAFLAQGFDDIDFIHQHGLTDNDLNAIGIQLAGHRKKLQTLHKIDKFLDHLNFNESSSIHSSHDNSEESEDENSDENTDTSDEDASSSGSIDDDSEDTDEESDEESDNESDDESDDNDE